MTDAGKMVHNVQQFCEAFERLGIPTTRLTMALMMNAAAYAIRENINEETFLEMCTKVYQRMKRDAATIPIKAKA